MTVVTKNNSIFELLKHLRTCTFYGTMGWKLIFLYICIFYTGVFLLSDRKTKPKRDDTKQDEYVLDPKPPPLTLGNYILQANLILKSKGRLISCRGSQVLK